MKRGTKRLLCLAGFALLAGASAPAAVRGDDLEKQIPRASSSVDRRTFVIYAFSRKGRYFTNGKKYFWTTTISRSRAIETVRRWRKLGFGVHVMWDTSRPLTKESTERWVAESYRKNYGKGGPQRPEAPVATGLGGTVWEDVRSGDRYWFSANGRLESGDASRGVTSNDRGTWTQSGNRVTTKLRGYRETWTLNGRTMTYGLRKLVRKR